MRMALLMFPKLLLVAGERKVWHDNRDCLTKNPLGFGERKFLKTHKPKNVPKRFIRLNKFQTCSYTMVYLRQHTFVLVQSNLLVHTKPLWLCLLTFAVFL